MANRPLASRLGKHAASSRILLAVALIGAIDAALPRAAGAERPAIVIADFEGDQHDLWRATGEAFGPGPAMGTLAGQMEVSGFWGKRLVNSFHGGDGSTGRLISPQFTIERPWINFLVGGGAHEGKTCINLYVDDKVVSQATGPNREPGGSERLDWHSWDVSPHAGKVARLEIVDEEKGPWGHINIDHIEQSDAPRGNLPAERTFSARARYLHLPVDNDATLRRVRLKQGDDVVREFDIKLAGANRDEAPDYWVWIDLQPFSGRELTVETALPHTSKALEGVRVSEELPGGAADYAESARPQFHFTSRRGWLNDPNGLVYSGGEYHLFYQHNPYGWDWGNMHWGHALSRDLIHWRELPIAIYPARYGDWAFSGSAVVDGQNTAGFKSGDQDVLVAAYTSTGRGECIVYSNDRGRTWREYEGNPVVKHRGRDPRLLWHEPTQRWIMAVYNEEEGQSIDFHTSPDLKAWRFESRLPGFYECPDLVELAVDGDKSRRQWILYAADGRYLVGDFDGHRFKGDPAKHQLWHGNFYAAQTFTNVPEGRIIQIGWGRGITFEGMPFNQQMTVPCELSLRTTPDGVRLFALPVAELAALRTAPPLVTIENQDLTEARAELAAVRADLLDIELEIALAGAARLTLDLYGTELAYDAESGKFTWNSESVDLPLDGRALRMRVLLDRGSVEVFLDGGRVAVSLPHRSRGQELRLSASGGSARIKSLQIYELSSAWQTMPQ